MYEDDEDGQVVCRLCEQLFDYINDWHLKYVHGITCFDYQNEFPGAPMQGRNFIETYQADRDAGLQAYWDSPEGEIRRDKMSTRTWWDSPEGKKRKEEMSRNPIALRGN